jgi:hypothetical protein
MQSLPLTLPQHIHDIHALTFHWLLLDLLDDPYHFFDRKISEQGREILFSQNDWTVIWHNISTMKGLHTLNVKLDVFPLYWRVLNAETVQRLVSPIRKVIGPKDFILSLPFPAGDDTAAEVLLSRAAVDGWEGSNPWDELPCTIRRIQYEG